RPGRPQRCVEVGALALAGPAPDPGGVDEAPADAAELDQLVHRVTGGARHRVHQDPVLARQLVEQAGLSHVGAADERHPARGGPRAASAGACGSAASRASSRSPLPRPCSALTGQGSPSPSAHNADAAGSPGASSTLFAATTTGLPERRSTVATASSESVMPTV